MAFFHFSGLRLRQTNHCYLLGFDSFNNFIKPVLFHYSQSELPTNSYFQKMRDDREAGPCKASEEEVRRYIRIKLKESFRVKGIGQAEEVHYWARIRTSAHRKPHVSLTRAQSRCKHRQPCGQPKVPDSGYAIPLTPRVLLLIKEDVGVWTG